MAFAPSHRMLRLAPLAALWAILFAASAAAAPSAERKVRLEHVREPGAEKCHDKDVVRRAILNSMKHDPILGPLAEDPFSPEAKATLRVVIRRVGRKFQSSVELRDDEGKLLLARPLPEHAVCAPPML